MRVNPFTTDHSTASFCGLAYTLFASLLIWLALEIVAKQEQSYQADARNPLPPVQCGITYHPLKAWCNPR